MLSIIDNTGALWSFPDEKLDITISYINRIGRHVEHISPTVKTPTRGTTIGKTREPEMVTIWKMRDIEKRAKRREWNADKENYKNYRRNLDRQLLCVCESSRISDSRI